MLKVSLLLQKLKEKVLLLFPSFQVFLNQLVSHSLDISSMYRAPIMMLFHCMRSDQKQAQNYLGQLLGTGETTPTVLSQKYFKYSIFFLYALEKQS